MQDFSKKDIENQENIDQDERLDVGDNANVAESDEFPEELAETETDKLTAELTEQKEKYLRLYAEFDNFRRRSAKERIELMQTAGKEVIVSLLDVLDDCDRAEKQLQESDENAPAQEGVLLVFNKLRSILSSKGVTPMESKGKDFDPDQHEAVSQIPVTDPKLKGKVVDELMKGYYLNDKIIRFAKVVVGQ